MYIGVNDGRKRYNEVVLLHLIGAVMILLCHFFQKEHIYSLGELFISGVPLFFFLSGFLAGKKIYEKGYYTKRAVRILMPLYLWIIPCMIVLWLSENKAVQPLQTLFLLTNSQGLNYIYWKSDIYQAVLGLGHLWFTTVVFVCYLLVPVFEKIIDNIGLNRKKWFFIMTTVIVIVQPLVMYCGFQISYIISFFLGFLGCKIGIKTDTKAFFKVSLVCACITILRFVLRGMIDGSDYYDRYFALISAAAVGIWLFYFVFWIGETRHKTVEFFSKNRAISYLSSISYEIYIVHFWFLNGKWQVANYIRTPVILYAVVLMFTVVFASMLHMIASRVQQMILK